MGLAIAYPTNMNLETNAARCLARAISSSTRLLSARSSGDISSSGDLVNKCAILSKSFKTFSLLLPNGCVQFSRTER